MQRRLANLNSQFTAVFWVDNTPGAKEASQADCAPGVRYLPQGSNVGLATALNVGCDAALSSGFLWVVTFDQDSDINSDFLPQHIDRWNGSDPLTFMLGCNYADSGELESPRFKAGDRVHACRTVITSGCLMCLSTWSELGRFRDDYFIDGVDHEICLRGRSRGLVVARHGRVLMRHRIGDRSANYKLFPYLHSPLRKYYGMRNGTRNILQYATSEPVWAAKKCISLTWEFAIALLFESNKRQKAKAMLRGLRDGIRSKMGTAPDDLTA